MSADQLMIVVVLFRTAANESSALTSVAAASSILGEPFRVEVHDNSETPVGPHAVPGLDIGPVTLHPENPGLAIPYNCALQRAQTVGCEWVLLLDQDTTVTAPFLAELLRVVRQEGRDERLAVILPRLMGGRRRLSPHRPMRVRTRPIWVPGRYAASTGYHFFNSGAAVRVSAAVAVGGYPGEFPLDFLDHAMAARLRAAGYDARILESMLQHQFSMLEPRSVSRHRFKSILTAEERFHEFFGGSQDRLWLMARRLIRLVLVLTMLRESPSPTEELRGLGRALLLFLRPTLPRSP